MGGFWWHMAVVASLSMAGGAEEQAAQATCKTRTCYVRFDLTE